MTLRSDAEFVNTREKLKALEDRYEALRDGAEPNARLRELTMQSLKRLINQLTEEIARYQAHQPARR
ncbi:MAG: hypothetical protein ACREJC_09345 [Tepidisphaeraceae bacterium]